MEFVFIKFPNLSVMRGKGIYQEHKSKAGIILAKNAKMNVRSKFLESYNFHSPGTWNPLSYGFTCPAMTL